MNEVQSNYIVEGGATVWKDVLEQQSKDQRTNEKKKHKNRKAYGKDKGTKSFAEQIKRLGFQKVLRNPELNKKKQI